MGDLEEEEDYEAFEMRQKAEQTVKDQAQEDYDRQHAAEEREGFSDDEEEDYDDELERADGDMDEEDFDGQTTKESELGENLSKAKLSQQDYVKRAQSAKGKKKGKYGVTVPKPFGFDMRDKTRPKSIRERKIDAMVQDK